MGLGKHFYKGEIGMPVMKGNMDSRYYCNALDEGLIIVANEKHEIIGLYG